MSAGVSMMSGMKLEHMHVIWAVVALFVLGVMVAGTMLRARCTHSEMRTEHRMLSCGPRCSYPADVQVERCLP